MSEKKSKSKSKDKKQKPEKQGKQKKSAERKSKKQGSKASKDDLNKSRISKISKPNPQQLNQSGQFEMSFFKPFAMNAAQPSINLQICPFHKQKNTIFCEICEQVGCDNCLLYGPHNNQMHRVSKIKDCYSSRNKYLNDLVCGPLIQKRNQLTKHLQNLTLLGDQLRYQKSGIEKHTKIEFQEMLERTTVSAGRKFAMLHHQMAELQKDLEAINSLGNQFYELTNMNPESAKLPQNNPHKGMVPFLLRSKFLHEDAEQLISKPIKTSIDVYPYDLPREITEKKLILEKNKANIQLLGVKDETIWNLMENKKHIERTIWANFQEEAAFQVEQWRKLRDRIEEELTMFDLKCQKCQVQLSQSNVNDKCKEGEYHSFQE